MSGATKVPHRLLNKIAILKEEERLSSQQVEYELKKSKEFRQQFENQALLQIDDDMNHQKVSRSISSEKTKFSTKQHFHLPSHQADSFIGSQKNGQNRRNTGFVKVLRHEHTRPRSLSPYQRTSSFPEVVERSTNPRDYLKGTSNSNSQINEELRVEFPLLQPLPQMVQSEQNDYQQESFHFPPSSSNVTQTTGNFCLPRSYSTHSLHPSTTQFTNDVQERRQSFPKPYPLEQFNMHRNLSLTAISTKTQQQDQEYFQPNAHQTGWFHQTSEDNTDFRCQQNSSKTEPLMSTAVKKPFKCNVSGCEFQPKSVGITGEQFQNAAQPGSNISNFARMDSGYQMREQFSPPKFEDFPATSSCQYQSTPSIQSTQPAQSTQFRESNGLSNFSDPNHYLTYWQSTQEIHLQNKDRETHQRMNLGGFNFVHQIENCEVSKYQKSKLQDDALKSQEKSTAKSGFEPLKNEICCFGNSSGCPAIVVTEAESIGHLKDYYGNSLFGQSGASSNQFPRTKQEIDDYMEDVSQILIETNLN